MEFQIPANSQFACIAIESLSLSNELNDLIDLGAGRYALIKPTFALEQFWQSQLGEIATKQIQESNLLLATVTSSDRSDGSIDRELIRSVRSSLYSLFVQGIYFQSGGILFCGGKTSGSIVIRSVQHLDNYFFSRETVTASLDPAVFHASSDIADGLESLYLAQDSYRRLKRGFHSYLDGFSARHEESRIRHFVRAIEAIVRPDIGKTRRHFVYRGQLFVGRGTDAMDLLGDLYDLRSCAEHMNDLHELYPALSQKDIDNRTALRSFQAELLASYVYRRICENADLRSVFATD